MNRKGEDALISLRDVVRVVLDERKKAGDFTQNDDLLDILLTYQQHGEQPLSDDDIILTCWDMFIAGHETTARKLNMLNTNSSRPPLTFVFNFS